MEHPLDTAGAFVTGNLIWIGILLLTLVIFAGAIWAVTGYFGSHRNEET